MGTTPSFSAMFLKGDNFRDILFAYRCMGTFPAFPPFFSKGDSFQDFQFAYLNDEDFPKMVSTFSSPERVPIHLNFVKGD